IDTGYISECNDAMAKMYGSDSKDNILGRKLQEFSLDRDTSIKRLVDFVKHNFQTKLLDNSEYDIDGSIKYFRNSYSGYISEGVLKWIWGIQTDITEKKESEKLQQVMYDIANEALSVENLEELFDKIRINIGKIVNSSNLFIALLNNDKKKLKIAYSTSMDKINLDLTNKKSITKYVIDTDKSLLLSLDDINELHNKGHIELIGRPAQSWLGVPLHLGKSVIGAVVLQSYTNPKQFSNKHLEFLSFISNQIAISIERNFKDEQMRNSLKEKEVLLKEVHHRVKNNLQVISSLLSLQTKQVKDKKSLELFRETRDRVRSISLVHERLYATKDFSSIDFNDYVYNLGYELFRTYGINPDRVSLNININNVVLDVESAVPCGLVINELISNSLKYAFPGSSNKRKGRVTISMKEKQNGIIELKVSDNGVGVPEGIDILHLDSLGLKLVSILVEDQLQGKIRISSKEGLSYKISFKKIL
ncbi:GAF domain-containing protein, partial [bacterium]|nr:GAF domain-containing protein [bacterium]